MATKSLFLSGKNIQSFIDSLNSCIVILDAKYRIVLVNRVWREFYNHKKGVDENYGIGKNYLDLCSSVIGINSEKIQLVTEGLIKVLNDESIEEIVEYECKISQKKQWFKVNITKYIEDQNFIVLTHCDISDIKVVEENLSDTEHLFKSVIEQSSEGISIIDSDGKIIEWNKAEERITGRSREDTIGLYMWDVQAELRAGKNIEVPVEVMKKGIQDLLADGVAPWAGQTSTVDIMKSDGTLATIENLIFPIKHNHGYLACSISRDLSELRHSLTAQKLSESRFRTYVNYSPVIAMIVNREGDFLDVNPQACKSLGYSEAEFLKMKISSIIPDNELDKSIQIFEKLVKEGTTTSEIKLLTKEGDCIQLYFNAVVLPDKTLMILCNDITELKDYQTKLKESEAFLNSIFDNIPSMISVKEAESCTFFKINRLAEEYIGKSNQEILGKKVHDLFPNEEANFYAEQDELTLKSKHIVDIPIENVFTREQKQKFFHEKKVPMFDEDGQPRFILSISEDITDQIQLEIEAKAHLDKLEAISKLTTRMQKPASLEEMLPVLMDVFLETIHAPMGSIWLYKQDQDELVPAFYSGSGHDNRLLVDVPLKPGQGIPGMVFLTQETHITRNYNEDKWFLSQKKGLMQDSLGGITLPLRTTNSVIGVINISTTSMREFSDEDVKLLTTLSEIAGNSIQTISLKEQTEQRLMRLSALSAIDRAISSSFDMMVSFEILVSNVISQLNMDAADVLLYNPHSQLLEYSTGQGFISNTIESACLRLGESLAGKAAVTREMVIVKNLLNENYPFANQQMAIESFVTYYGVPLVAKGELRGVLEVFSRSQHTPDDDWINFLKSLAEQAAIAIDNTEMFENLRRSNMELGMAYNATIEGWSRALDLRDKETEGHTLRVTELTERLARAFNLPEKQIKYIRWGALLHDIGKMGVPDGILLKPGPLTDEEWVVMRMHPKYAFEMLAPIGYLSQAIDIPYCHHEKWDGTGYPRGLKGEQIPLSARIFAVVDIWDALNSDRPYRKAWPQEKVIEHIRSLSGTHLDPKVVDFCLASGLFTKKL